MFEYDDRRTSSKIGLQQMKAGEAVSGMFIIYISESEDYLGSVAVGDSCHDFVISVNEHSFSGHLGIPFFRYRWKDNLVFPFKRADGLSS